MAELNGQENVGKHQQRLNSLLCNKKRGFLIRNNGQKVPVSELVSKTVALYFSAHWCPPCQAFTPNLIQVYDKLMERKEPFEIVFISSDRDQKGFEDYYSSMPWLALPFGDKTKDHLQRTFNVQGIPTLIVIGPDGETVTTNARSAVSDHGARAYPFTDAHLARLREGEGRRWKIWRGCWSCFIIHP